jgi:hypothetical protein
MLLLDVQSAQNPQANHPVHRSQASGADEAPDAVPLDRPQGLLDHGMVRYAHHPSVAFLRTA